MVTPPISVTGQAADYSPEHCPRLHPSCLLVPQLVLQPWKEQAGSQSNQALSTSSFSHKEVTHISTSFNKSPTWEENLCLQRYTCTRQLPSIETPGTQRTLWLVSVCITRGGWEMPGTISLDCWPTSHGLRGARSLILSSSSSHPSGDTRQPSWMVMWMTSEFLEPGDLSEIAHPGPEPRLHLFSPKPTKQAMSLKWQASWYSKGILTSLQGDERRLPKAESHHHPKEPPLGNTRTA